MGVYFLFRIIEHCILTAESPGNMVDVVQNVIECLASTTRSNPQDLDKAVAGLLREVIRYKDLPHGVAVKEKFVNS